MRGKTEPFSKKIFKKLHWLRKRGESLKHEKLMRDVKREALARMEDAARTEADFNAVVAQWDKRDENRERKERYHEVGRDEKTLEIGYSEGMVFPVPISHPAWHEAIKGDFLSIIFDNAIEMWQLIDDKDIAAIVNSLTDKQKDVLFLSAVRLCTAVHIACYNDKTDRAVRKLLAAALDSIRDKLAPIIREQIKAGWPKMTLAKREFLEWYDEQKTALDNNKNG